MADTERNYPPRRRRRRRRRINYTAIVFWLVVLLVAVSIIALVMHLVGGEDLPEPSGTTAPTTAVTEAPTLPPTDPPTEPSTGPVVPEPVVKTGTASIAAMGDMLMHMPCIRPALDSSTGEYDFTPYFTNLKPYIEGADFAVANLETTLAGPDNGYEYNGYPDFNCPDGIVSSLKSTGFDMLLTANNHTYDTHSVGFHRTQQVIAESGLLHTGTMPDGDVDNYQIIESNGIRIGMICYTYEDSSDPNVVAPNGRTMTDGDEVLINSFNVNELPTFYANMEADIAAMEADGAEAIVLYIHWGVEYQTTQNASQETIAQKMCDLGVDVIVGGHPHVIQPMDLLTGTADPDHKTVCLYSTGNALSNQRRDLMRLDTGHTEDGIVFNFSFARYSDGTVRLEEVELIPTWINMYTSSETGKKVYDILPLDKDLPDWQTSFDLTDSGLKDALESYDRTMAIVGEGLEEVQEYLAALPAIE